MKLSPEKEMWEAQNVPVTEDEDAFLYAMASAEDSIGGWREEHRS